MPAVTVVLQVPPRASGELARSALSVAQQEFADWELVIVHGGDAALRAATADLAGGDARISGADSVLAGLANSSGAVVCWLESGARFPSGYLAAVVAAMADPAARVVVAARQIEHGPRFGRLDRVLPDSPAEPSRLAGVRAPARC